MRAIAYLALTIGMAASAGRAGAELRGDPRAVALASRMVEAIGGARLWAGARHLRIEERAFSASRGGTTIFCRDLEQPRLSVVRVGARLDPDYVIGSKQGWAAGDGGKLESLPASSLQAFRASWPRNIYVMYHRLAKQDPRLRLAYVGELEFAAHEDGQEIGRFVLDRSGHVVRWFAKALPGRRDEDWIYGPAKDLGAVSFPDWGTRRDGSYRFYYTQVEVSDQPLVEDIFRLERRSRSCISD